jgi:hypothetical protein
MDMSDPLVQQMLDDDRAEALARIRAAKEDADNERKSNESSESDGMLG